MNPSFRLYDVDSKNKLLLNYKQYGFNVTEANLFVENEPNWKIRYEANEFFELENLFDYKGIDKMLQSLAERDDKFDGYLSHFFSEGNGYEANKNNLG